MIDQWNWAYANYQALLDWKKKFDNRAIVAMVKIDLEAKIKQNKNILIETYEEGHNLNQFIKLYPKKNSFGSAAVRMSGSGSSCFSLFEDKFSANLFNQKIQDAGYWSVSTKFITEF